MGPKTEAQLRAFPESEKSRQIRQILDLLHYPSSDEFKMRDIFVYSLIKESRDIYGEWFPRTPLRSAVSALSAALHPSHHYRKYYIHNRGNADREVNAVVRRKDEILCSDVFAAFLLGILAKIDSLPIEEITKYADRCICMLGICYENPKMRLESSYRLLTNFGPLILDWLESLYLRNGDQKRWYKTIKLRSRICVGTTSFERRLRYIQSTNGEWESNIGWAVRFTQSLLTDKLTCIVPLIADRERVGEFGRDGFVKKLFQSFFYEHGDTKFRDAIGSCGSWKEQIPTRYILRSINN